MPSAKGRVWAHHTSMGLMLKPCPQIWEKQIIVIRNALGARSVECAIGIVVIAGNAMRKGMLHVR